MEKKNRVKVCKRCGKEINVVWGDYHKVGGCILCDKCYGKIAHEYLKAFWRGEVC